MTVVMFLLMLILMVAGEGRVVHIKWSLEPADCSCRGGVHGNTRRAPEVRFCVTTLFSC